MKSGSFFFFFLIIFRTGYNIFCLLFSMFCCIFLHSPRTSWSLGAVGFIQAVWKLAWLRERQGVMAQTADYVNLVAVFPGLGCDRNVLNPKPA